MTSEIEISVVGSSIGSRMRAITQPTARPIATPPAAPSTKFMPASASEKLPVTSAALAYLNAISAVESLTSASPSTIVT